MGVGVTTGTAANELIGPLWRLDVGVAAAAVVCRVPDRSRLSGSLQRPRAACRVLHPLGPAGPVEPDRGATFLCAQEVSSPEECRVSRRLRGVSVLCAAQISEGRRFHRRPSVHVARGPALSRTDMNEEVGGKGTQSGGDHPTGDTQSRWLSVRFFSVSPVFTNRKLNHSFHHQSGDRS